MLLPVLLDCIFENVIKLDEDLRRLARDCQFEALVEVEVTIHELVNDALLAEEVVNDEEVRAGDCEVDREEALFVHWIDVDSAAGNVCLGGRSLTAQRVREATLMN